MHEKNIKHLITSSDLTRADYQEIMRRGKKFIDDGIPSDLFTNMIISTLFFLPSTRTMTAGQSAFLRGGGGWIGVMGEEGLSMGKGESLEDTVHEFGEVSDIVLLRHPDDDAAERCVPRAQVPIVNGGCGSREHALAAAMLMIQYNQLWDSLEGIKVGIYGTPGINRCIKAMLPIMGMFGMDVVYDNFEILPIPENVIERTRQNGIKRLEYAPINEWIGDVDILVCTRGLQKGILSCEQFSEEDEKTVLEKYKPINLEMANRMRPDAHISMLFPRIFEIEREVDTNPRALYMTDHYYTKSLAAIFSFLLDREV